ncbi:hypothetical protein D3C73_1333420 [compost metagenome]
MTSNTDGGMTLISQLPSRPTKIASEIRWTTAAPQMATTAASSARLLPGFAPMLVWAISAAGRSLLEMLPIMNAWYIAAGPRMG